jgi:hypothetical protein
MDRLAAGMALAVDTAALAVDAAGLAAATGP